MKILAVAPTSRLRGQSFILAPERFRRPAHRQVMKSTADDLNSIPAKSSQMR
jgi:hypothetical protein